MENPLLHEMIQEIERDPRQAIPFSRYMELALYHPKWGYYRREWPKLGREGDYFTNAHVGEFYGLILSRLVVALLRSSKLLGDCVIVEVGAGDGRLAEQMGTGLLESGFLAQSIRFYLVESSPYHLNRSRERLASSPIPYRFVTCLKEIPPARIAFVYSNELVDAFPVHRIKKDRGRILEAFVAKKGKPARLEEVWLPTSASELRDLGKELPEGKILEVPLPARRFLKEVAAWMDKGWLLTVDYGSTTAELREKPGTLRGFCRHRIVDEWLNRPGEVDLTCDVNFDFLRIWGEQEGLCQVGEWTQSEFLLKYGILDFLPHSAPRDPFSPEAKRTRVIKQLIHPQAMGEVFRVLLQAKGLPIQKNVLENLMKEDET